MSALKKIKVDESNEMESPVGNHNLYTPSFSIDAKQMSEIKDWEVGATYRLMIDVKMTRYEENKQSTSASMDIVGYKYIPKKSIDEMTDKEFETYQGESLDKGSLA